MMALEAGTAQTPKQAPRPEFRGFADAVENTLERLVKRIRGGRVAERDFPDLREKYARLAASGDPQMARYALANVEADRMTNSLNTLREQTFGWQRLTR